MRRHFLVILIVLLLPLYMASTNLSPYSALPAIVQEPLEVTPEEVAALASGEDWLTGWSYRKKHNISAATGAGQNYTVRFNIDGGAGIDAADTIYLDGKMQSDWDDIRFTASNGSTLLSYWIEERQNSETQEYYVDDALSMATYAGNEPEAYYDIDGNRTYVFIQGPSNDPYVTYYDHENDTWANRYKVGENPLGDDDHHGAPVGWVDDNGYIHCIFGGHVLGRMNHYRTDSPNDISAWSLINYVDVVDVGTYPLVQYDTENDVVHVVYRYRASSINFDLAYKNSTDDGATWSTRRILVDCTDNNYMYPAENIVLGHTDSDILRMTWRIYNSPSDTAYDIYYMYMNVTTGTLYNVTDDSQGTQVAFADMDNVKALDFGDSNYWVGQGPYLDVLNDGSPYIIWHNLTNTEPFPCDTNLLYWNSTQTAWIQGGNITRSYGESGGNAFILNDATNITAFISEGKNMTRYTWDGDTWTRAEWIYNSTDRPLSIASIPVYWNGSYDSELQVIFSEFENYATDIKAYAWGSNGILNRTYDGYAITWVRIPDDISSINYTMYIYYGNPSASDIGNGTETFIAWDDFDLGYSDGDPLKAVRGWTQANKGGTDVWEVDVIPSGTTLGMYYAEDGGGGTAMNIYNTFSDKASIAVHYDYYHQQLGYQQYFLMYDVDDSIPSATCLATSPSPIWEMRYHNGTGWTSLAPTWTIGEDTWYEIEVRALNTTGLGTMNWTVNDVDHVGGLQVAGTYFDTVRFSGHPDYNDQFYIDEFFIRAFVFPEPAHSTYGEEELGHYDYVDQISTEDAQADIGTHSGFSDQQGAPDSTYDTLTEEDTGSISNNYEDWFTNYGTDIDSYPDVGTETTPENAQDLGDSDYMNLQEADNSGGGTTEYKADSWTDSAAEWTDDALAYDGDWGTAAYDLGVAGGDDYPSNYASGFDSGAAGSGTITQVDIVVRLSAAGFTGASDWWQLTLDVGASTDNALSASPLYNQALTNLTYTDVTEPNGGGWTWAEVRAAQVHFDTERIGGADNADVYIYEYAFKITISAPVDYELDFEYQWTSANYSETYEEVCINVQTADQTAGENLKAWEWTGSDWALLGTVTDDDWNNFTATYITGSTYYIKLNDTLQSEESDQDSWNIDSIILHTWSTATNYQLDLEEQWTSARYDQDAEYLCIKWGTVPSSNENLNITVWNSTDTSWNFLYQVTSSDDSSWTNISISAWLLSTTFTIQFIDTNQTGDSDTQDTWQKDSCLLWTYPSENVEPVNDQAPIVDNPDDTDNLYAFYKTYYIEANVSDANGENDIEYLDLTLASDDQVTTYCILRYNHSSHEFTEQSDPNDNVILDTTNSQYYSSGNDVNIEFWIEANWTFPDNTDMDMRMQVYDQSALSDDDWSETVYDVETRLDLSVGPTLNDGDGTADRGEFDDAITSSGTVVYYTSVLHPAADEIDIWVGSSEYGTNVGPWNMTNYEDTGGTFSGTTYADDAVGIDTHTFKVVEQGEAYGDTDLFQATQSDTYITDRLNITIVADSETPDNNQQVNFTLTVQYDYDDSTCTTYIIQIARNASAWYTFDNSNKTLFNDTNTDNVYLYNATTLGDGVSETTHGLSTANPFLTNTVTVIWGGGLQTVLINQIIELFESTTPAQTLVLAVNELIPLADSVGTVMISVITILEIIGLAAAVSTQQTVTLSIGETLGFGSVVTSAVSLETTVNEIIELSDSQQLAMSLEQMLYEVLPFSDIVNVTSTSIVSLGEVIDLSSTVATIFNGAVSINETIDLASITETAMSVSITQYELIELFSSVSTDVFGEDEYFVTVNEIIDLSGTISTVFNGAVTVNDVIGLYDSAVPALGSYVTVLESLPLADTISTVLSGNVSVLETIPIADTVTTTLAAVVNIAETILFFDHVTVEIPIFSIVLYEIIPFVSDVTVSGVPSVEEGGFFYELFLSQEMWGYLGPLGLVIGGYIVADKDRFLGILWFIVECLFVYQYLTLVSASPVYWWHIYIIMLGGLFTIVYPLIGRRTR